MSPAEKGMAVCLMIISPELLLALWLWLLDHRGFQNPNVLQRAVEGVGFALLDAVNDIKALGDVAKDSVLAIQMRGAANYLIG